MTVRIKDISGALYEFTDVDKTLENREQIILRYEDTSEAIFIKKNIIYAVRGRETDDLHSNPKQ